MGDTPQPEYTGLDKPPGWLATVITIVIGAIFSWRTFNQL